MARPPLPEGTRIGPFALRGLLREDALGLVYRAEDPAAPSGTGKAILQEYFPEGARREDGIVRPGGLGREAFEHGLAEFGAASEAALAVRHRALAPVIDLVEAGGTLWRAGDEVIGESHGAIQRRDGVVSPDYARSVAAMIGEGLQALHAAGLVHGDLSPASLRRGDDGYPVLGVSPRYSKIGERPPSLPDAGDPAQAHLAPELADGGPATPQADVYALGSSLYALLTGEAPPAPETRGAGAATDPLSAEAFGKAHPGWGRLAPALAAALQSDPAERPASVADFLGAMGAAAAAAATGGRTREMLKAAPALFTGLRTRVPIGRIRGVVPEKWGWAAGGAAAVLGALLAIIILPLGGEGNEAGSAQAVAPAGTGGESRLTAMAAIEPAAPPRALLEEAQQAAASNQSGSAEPPTGPASTASAAPPAAPAAPAGPPPGMGGQFVWMQTDRSDPEAVRAFLARSEDPLVSALAAEQLDLLDRASWAEAAGANTQDAIRGYLAAFPGEAEPPGRFAADAARQLRALARAERFQREEARRMLSVLGYAPGRGRDSLESAIRAYQSDLGAKADGTADDALLIRLEASLEAAEMIADAEDEAARARAESVDEIKRERERLAADADAEARRAARQIAQSGASESQRETAGSAAENVALPSTTASSPALADRASPQRPAALARTAASAANAGAGAIERAEARSPAAPSSAARASGATATRPALDRESQLAASATPAPSPEPRRVGEVFRDCALCPEMTVLPAGAFRMGSSPREDGHTPAEAPQRSVTFSVPVTIGVSEVTRGEYQAYLDATGRPAPQGCNVHGGADSAEWVFEPQRSFADPGFPQTDAHPAVCVSWQEAAGYARWLSEKTGRPYRLPSEAEWEYAARGGQSRARFWGRRAESGCPYVNGADRMAGGFFSRWVTLECSDGALFTAPRDGFEPNAFGLYHTVGNVWEWAEDCFAESLGGVPGDGRPQTRTGCNARAIRGGAWASSPEFLRAAKRSGDNPAARYDMVGFRVAAGR